MYDSNMHGERIKIIIHSFYSLSYDRSTVSTKETSPDSAI